MAFCPCSPKSRKSAPMTSSLSLLREPRSRPAGLPDTPGCQRLVGMCLCSRRVVIEQQYGSIGDSANVAGLVRRSARTRLGKVWERAGARASGACRASDVCYVCMFVIYTDAKNTKNNYSYYKQYIHMYYIYDTIREFCLKRRQIP